MSVEVELALLFVFAVFFSILYILKGNRPPTAITFCALSWLSWMVMSIFWLMNGSGTDWMLSLLPFAVGTLFLIQLIFDIFEFYGRAAR